MPDSNPHRCRIVTFKKGAPGQGPEFVESFNAQTGKHMDKDGVVVDPDKEGQREEVNTPGNNKPEP